MNIYIYVNIYNIEPLVYEQFGHRSLWPLDLILLPRGPAVPRFPRHSDGVTHPRHQVFGATNVEAFHLSAFRREKKKQRYLEDPMAHSIRN